MRVPEYLSPTSINLYYKEPEEFYIRYLSDFRPPRFPQTEPMAVGSAFDAFVKSFLHCKLFGEGKDPRFEPRTLFEAQVESQHHEWAWKQGEHAFKVYRESGALSDLLLELQQAVGEPKFEIEVRGVVSASSETVNGSVVLLGKPDVYFINRLGNPVILDWKVNSWCSKTACSPKKGYIRIRHGSSDRSKDKSQHRDCHLMMVQGMMINAGMNLEDVDKDWATQLCIYGWLTGMPVGSDFIVGLDQLACGPSGGEFPEVRVAEHRLKVGKTFQWELFQKASNLWQMCQKGTIFSTERQVALDAKAKVICDASASGSEEDKAFLAMTSDRMW